MRSWVMHGQRRSGRVRIADSQSPLSMKTEHMKFSY